MKIYREDIFSINSMGYFCLWDADLRWYQLDKRILDVSELGLYKSGRILGDLN